MINKKLLNISPESDFFRNIFQKVLKHPGAQYPKEELKIKSNDRTFLFKFEWLDEKTCGIEVFEEQESM